MCVTGPPCRRRFDSVRERFRLSAIPRTPRAKYRTSSSRSKRPLGSARLAVTPLIPTPPPPPSRRRSSAAAKALRKSRSERAARVAAHQRGAVKVCAACRHINGPRIVGTQYQSVRARSWRATLWSTQLHGEYRVFIVPRGVPRTESRGNPSARSVFVCVCVRVGRLTRSGKTKPSACRSDRR